MKRGRECDALLRSKRACAELPTYEHISDTCLVQGHVVRGMLLELSRSFQNVLERELRMQEVCFQRDARAHFTRMRHAECDYIS